MKPIGYISKIEVEGTRALTGPYIIEMSLKS